jgi:NADPH:quinone reductase-like Zn-dependent oxidoreductase
MQVAAFAELTGPDGVEIQERPDPEPDEGEAVVDVAACSINRHDLWILQGDSAMVTEGATPFLSGLDVAGIVREAGPGASVSEGDRVLLCPNQTCGTCKFCREGPENLCQSFMLYHGGLAEQALVEADRLVPLPEGVDPVTASALPTAYLTAWHMMRKAEVEAGDLVLVPGATGGVGVACIQLLDLVGAHSIGTSSSESKLGAIGRLGCDHPVLASSPEEVESAVRGIGTTDAVLNSLSGEYATVGLKTMKRGGTQVVCGATADPELRFKSAPFFLQQQSVVGSTMGTQPELARLVEFVAQGTLDPVVERTYPLAETGAAFRDMVDRQMVGKLVVTP